MYYCSGCGLAAIVYESGVFIACDCNKAVVAEMTASMSGVGGVSA